MANAGEQLAGDDLAGEAPVLRTASAPRVRPAALHFDALTRDFPLDSDGHYEGIHPIDSRVEMALLIEFGRVPSAARTGNTLRQVTHVDPRRLNATARDRVSRALSSLIAAGDISLENVEAEPRALGGMDVRVDYFNERLPDRPRRTINAR